MLIIFGIALFLRIYFSYHNVFAAGWVNFQQSDCWYHMKQVMGLSLHFPHRNLFDPYYLYPGGAPVSFPPFFYLFWGFFAWVFGAGSPSQKVIETVGAYLPAILGALVTVPVYFIGKELFNRKAGLLAAALIAILPGRFLWRSMLGFPDYHVMETLLSTVTMMFLILAVKSAKQRKLSFDSLQKRDWRMLGKPLLYSLLAGIALGLYLLTWRNGGLFIFIIFVFAVLQYISDHLRGRSTDYLCIVGVFCFLISLLLILPAWNGYSLWNLQFASLLIGILTFLALGILSVLMATRNMKRYYYPVALMVLGGISVALFYLINPSLLNSILDKVSMFTPSRGMLTIAEVERLSLSLAWDIFTTGFYLALISLVLIAYLVIKEGNAPKTLLLVWSLIMLVATFGQNRFAYYFAVNVALLATYLPWRVLNFVGLWKTSEEIPKQQDVKSEKVERDNERVKLSKKSKRKQAKARRGAKRTLVTEHRGAMYAYRIIAIVVVFFLVFYPNIGPAIDLVKANTGVPLDWQESLVWMREKTPDPLGNPDLYYELSQRPPAGQAYSYPASAYGVMSWWDYGYWITYIAHRIPNTNPSQAHARDAALFFTTRDESSGNQVLNRLGSKYVIIDYSMASANREFDAMATWAGKSKTQFFDVFYQSIQTGTLQPIMFYYPEYYQSMCSRLYLFAGKEWIPQQTLAISWNLRELTSTDGSTFQAKVITDQKSFSTYDSAKAFVDAHQDYRIVGTDPFVSPVPLDKLEHFTLIHKSPTTAIFRAGETISIVEIFEYSPENAQMINTH
jgi:dolichyl-diphosphooligosaccharide--protein glycosyltransferase